MNNVAETVLINGEILTLDSENQVVEAVAIRDGKFLEVGETNEIQQLIGQRTKVIDLLGKTVIPGIIDSHTHPSNIAARFMEIDCRAPPIRNIGEILELVKAGSPHPCSYP